MVPPVCLTAKLKRPYFKIPFSISVKTQLVHSWYAQQCAVCTSFESSCFVPCFRFCKFQIYICLYPCKVSNVEKSYNSAILFPVQQKMKQHHSSPAGQEIHWRPLWLQRSLGRLSVDCTNFFSSPVMHCSPIFSINPNAYNSVSEIRLGGKEITEFCWQHSGQMLLAIRADGQR